MSKENKSVPSGKLDEPIFEVWRQDDNGNKFLICSFALETDALAYVDEMTARGHKQVYWSEKK